MEPIINFYKGLDTLNLIIFWGVIIVIILLLIFAFILINKNKKLKEIVDNSLKNEDLPIKRNEIEKKLNLDTTKKELEKKENILPDTTKIIEKDEEHIETERKFVAEEHVRKYNNEEFIGSNIKTNNETTNKINTDIDSKMHISKEIEIPNKPYQRNVLREMSLSQTSPIGINRPINKEDKKLELAKDLEESLNKIEEEQKEITRERNIMQKEVIKKELSKIENHNQRKTEIKDIPRYEREYIQKNPNLTKFEETKKIEKQQIKNNFENIQEKNMKKNNEEKMSEYIPPQVKELLDKQVIPRKEKIQSSSEKYLEEVSKKLAEAEIPDEIERTDYELEQEENAIISYKELMEKKDSIQTIDEEEAIISIEELMNKSSNKSNKKEENKEETKLYNLTEEEENNKFLKELKQFRNDL